MGSRGEMNVEDSLRQIIMTSKTTHTPWLIAWWCGRSQLRFFYWALLHDLRIRHKDLCFRWCGRWDSNPHTITISELKSDASADYATTA